ncbi:MAG: hypothetical protein LBJ02_04645 [Bifidobacteriaceae bacterium]|jgi:hypothetical protein|nr:hypothetical protein [Bifidobacteriaceae bacterium]
MTLAELVTVMAIGSILMGLLTTVTVFAVRSDARNLARQGRVDDIRQASVWLGDALSHAALDPADTGAAVFLTAGPDKMRFTSALPPGDGGEAGGVVSLVTFVVGGACWTDGPAEAGVLRRCVQAPVVDDDGAVVGFCRHGNAGCPDDLFEDLVVARNVVGDDVFSYVLVKGGGVAEAVSNVTGSNDLARVTAVELKVRVAGERGSSDGEASATLLKRYEVREWSRL